MALGLLMSQRCAAALLGRQAVRCMATAEPNGTAQTVHVVGISGSLRKNSVNSGMLRAIAKRAPPHVNFEIISLANLPLYNDDLWQGGDRNNDASKLPEELQTFRTKIAQADAVVFASPEYNYSVTAPLKNAVDWCSKGPNLWNNKLVTVVAAAGASQGARSVLTLEVILSGLGVHYIPPRKFVLAAAFGGGFNKDGDVIDATLEQYLANEITNLAKWAPKYKQLHASL